MSGIPEISEEQIQEQFDSGSYSRGRQYARSGSIFDARQTGMTLKAQCRGSYASAYRLWATLNASGEIVDSDCSCPVGSGRCKHVAALLLTWHEHPEMFVPVQDTATALHKRSKDELIALIQQMLRQQPELEALLETPLPTAKKRAEPVSPEIYRRQAEAILRDNDYEWGAASEAVARLGAIMAIGDGFAAQEDWASAAAVYEAVSSAVLEHHGEFHDDDGELSGIVADCVSELRRCFDGVGDSPDARMRLLQSLFGVYRFDVDYGGTGLSDEVPELLLEHTTPDERRTIAEWVRAAMPTGDDSSADYERRAYGSLLLELEADTLDDETYLRMCREYSLVGDLIDRLLQMGRHDDALAEAGKLNDYELLGMADLFSEHGHGEAIENIIASRANKTQNVHLLDWLKARYRERGDTAAALNVARALFRATPILGLYQEIRELSKPSGRWEALRPTLRMFLQETKRDSLLIEIYLDEGEIDHALQALDTPREQVSDYPYFLAYGYGPDLEMRVARAAEATRPQRAVDLYKKWIEKLIAQQGRDNYQQACQLLLRVRNLYRRADDEAGWSAYIDDLRARHRRLRALAQELAAVGL